MMKLLEYGTVVTGNVEAEALSASVPLSFWGGVDVSTGLIQDIHHDLYGENLTGKILCVPFDKGSCSGSGVILEMIRQGTNPAGILCIEAEAVLALGPVIGERVYNRQMPIRTVPAEVLKSIKTGDKIIFAEDAIITE